MLITNVADNMTDAELLGRYGLTEKEVKAFIMKLDTLQGTLKTALHNPAELLTMHDEYTKDYRVRLATEVWYAFNAILEVKHFFEQDKMIDKLCNFLSDVVQTADKLNNYRGRDELH